MKILELTNFSAGVCGVWTRVLEESKRLTKNHEVRVFSSNLVKGSSAKAKPKENIHGVKISRFPAKKLGGESFMSWSFESSAKKYNPDIIIAHSYRHVHTTKALKIARELNSKVFLVTHAPFVKGNITRSFSSKIVVNFYDKFIGPRNLKKFDKIIAISKWEIPFLEKLSVPKEKIEYIPNGIPEEFFKQKKSKEELKILFLGRISPIKDLETLIHAMKQLKNKSIYLEIVGPAERDYQIKLNDLIRKLNIKPRVVFSPPIFDIKEKIKKIDSAKIFILPSKSEAMPQSLIEAMAREKIVIASDNQGSKDLIIDDKNGYLFPIGNSNELAKKIDFALTTSQTKLKREAKKAVEQFSWDKVVKRIEALIN